MNEHDVPAEEEVTRNAIADGESAEEFDERLTPKASEGDELLAKFLGTMPSDADAGDAPADSGGNVGTARADGERIGPLRRSARASAPDSLFPGDLAYCETALEHMRDTHQLELCYDVDGRRGPSPWTRRPTSAPASARLRPRSGRATGDSCSRRTGAPWRRPSPRAAATSPTGRGSTISGG